MVHLKVDTTYDWGGERRAPTCVVSGFSRTVDATLLPAGP